MHIEVICTGDEVLTGKIVNTNFSYISQKLEDVGLSVQWETTVGAACGFTEEIGRARFMFAPGVPGELKSMLEEQIIPRLRVKSGMQTAIHLKRVHSYGLGESHVDAMLAGVEVIVTDGSVKLG